MTQHTTLIKNLRDAIEQAHDTHIYDSDDEHPADCHYCKLIEEADEMLDSQQMFVNHYRCYRCNNEWNDIWSAQCDDDCPSCGARHCSPYKSEDQPT